ncbi:MAG TPA: hypothetical protein VMU98_04225 [Acidimicrobiales bacterium]|nr:hypothetical protein [Acidimicrobiales bacterium]
MTVSALVVGSLAALEGLLDDPELFPTWRGLDVVIVPTGAAFTSMVEASLASSTPFEARGARVEALMIADRSSNDEAHFVTRLHQADVVVLAEGSALHARSVWRASPVGEALASARCLLAVGETGSVLGSTMIDPRGGAPTTGLGYRDGLIITTTASSEQLTRTRTLLDASLTLAVVRPAGAVLMRDGTWRARGDVLVTRGNDVVSLGS